jgi:type IV secretory pathway VirB4 component
MSLTGLLFGLAGFGAAGALARLRDYGARQRGLVDFLPWAFLVASEPQGVVLNKDGSFTAAFELRGPDRASSTEADLNALSQQVSRALSGFVNSWTFHFNQVRRPAPAYPPAGHFPDPVTRLLDDCRREAYLRHGALYESVTFLNVTFRPPREVYQHALLRLQQGVAEERRTWRETLARIIHEPPRSQESKGDLQVPPPIFGINQAEQPKSKAR